ncbi:MAG: TVP38/TMEM64 family protein [Candidatus Tectomicrobia bacterium]|uniref:TVP38/TMEM64 family membrane protein n=1 Tax=Tectimicrobiota bacterium TaxID=2528274 RepID=A0A932I1C2_UNCTE|nr:TVP38/TMEM64 family protein [Candidatus Tectomicrobia bacterium]
MAGGNGGTENGLRRRRRIFWAVAAGALLLAAGGLYFGREIADGVQYLIRLQGRRERFRLWINSYGAWGPLVFIGLQVLQVVFSPIPGEVTGFLGGYVFGVWTSTVYSTVGLSLGSWICFLLGRWLGRPFVEKLISRAVLDKFDFLVAGRGAFLAFVFFSIPGFPKDYMCYLLGLSPLSTRTFLLVATFGRIPGTIMLSLQGANLYDERYDLVAGIFIGALVVILLFWYFAEPIRLWLRRKAEG